MHSGNENKKEIKCNILNIQKMTKKFGGLIAVSDFSMEVKKGEIKGLIGPNGAGKTTIINLISGYYRPNAGLIYYKEEEISKEKPDRRASKGIVRTFQQLKISKSMTVLDEIKSASFLQIKHGFFDIIFQNKRYFDEEKEIERRALELLNVMGIEDLAYELSEDLPFGHQRKVTIARSLALKPELLLLDEPASGLNPNETQEFVQALLKIRELFGLSIVLIEHDMSVIMNVCDSVTAINYGATIASGTPKEIQNNPAVILAYLGGTE